MRKLVTVAFLLSASSLMAKTPYKDELAKIQVDLQQKKTLHVDFKQTVYSSLRKKKKPSKGYGYFKKPAKFRWALETPRSKHLIYSGSEFAEINPKAKTGVIYPDSSGKLKKYAELVSIVMDVEKLVSRFDIKELKKSKSQTDIKLTPKMNDGIDHVDLVVSHAKKYISEVKITYKGGNYWHVEFSNPRTGDLPKDAFKIPDGKSYNLQTLKY